ncbi:MAG: bifunctional phosphoribosylaminoimidazolecarboxamide formyltransferase/IMP cyclohydrolase [Thermoanaerobaculia bacterium]|nr:MAG: bifunctional phosphoribosylaminoimidazolecarboxamide formyltransferase/IMP cyclohydrolase [Thermoanaerobaculia bacterium]
MLPARRALLSVSDKSGLAEFARGLAGLGIELVSTGGTAAHLREAGLEVTLVSAVTGAPEILDGRVKTLHPRIHGGLLADRGKPAHLAALAEHGIERIDVVAVNLYPFRQTAADPAAAPDRVVEMIDIGGPSMVRAAAKNFAGVAVVVDPLDYPRVLEQLRAGGGTVPLETRRSLARKAFAHTASYDAAIAGWFAARTPEADDFPELLSLDLERELVPRYGENPHQGAAVYRTMGGPGVLGGMTQLQGKDLSWNNLLDADAARKLVALYADPAVVIVKHNNPCGVGRGKGLVEAYARALECDPVSAFGSIVAVNRPLDAGAVEAMADLFIEVLIAPAVDEPALERLASKKNLRVLVCPPYAWEAGDVELRAVDGGFLAQHADGRPEDGAAWTCATRRRPTPGETRALGFAWSVCRYVKSNAIVVAGPDQTIGIGAGQMSRVDSCRIAIEKAQLPVAGAVAASDAFFPFRDGLDVLAAAGVTAVVQPGGSKRDDEVIAAADEHGLAMLLTGARHFRH